jgi:hypothetical protein
MLLYFRGCCDKLVKMRRAFETKLIKKASYLIEKDRLAEAIDTLKADYTDKIKALRNELDILAEKLFKLIGIQLDVEHYCADSWERGATLETIDNNVTDKAFLLHKLQALDPYDADNIKYAKELINRNKVEKFFELDIDSVVGYDRVLEFRSKLEKLTNKPVIPVWHTSRGIENYKRMCDEYSYVAIGGIVSKEIKPEHYKALPVMIKEAHKRNAKIHGLGFTSLEWLPKCPFDSVDSTAWTTGNRFGFVYQFNGKTMIKHDVPKGKRLADSRKVAEINYLEWIKFQKYAEKHL